MIELLKAKRVVEKRRGDLLGARQPGHRSDLQPRYRDSEVELSQPTRSNYKRIAEAWPAIETHLLEATVSTEVSQRLQ